MEYPCETTSAQGFVQFLSCNLLPHGYWFYVTGWIPEGKDAQQIDMKLMRKYGAGLGRSARARRKQLGYANVRYVRHGQFFVLLATHGKHNFFEEEKDSVRDIRRVPLQFGGYSISCRRGGRTRDGKPDSRWHSHVEIDRRHFRRLKAYFLEQAAHQSRKRMAMEFYQLPFEPYAPVRRQMLRLLRSVNGVRKRAAKEPIPIEVLPMRRRIVKPFEPARTGPSSALR